MDQRQNLSDETARISPFEQIRKQGEDGGEYWSARDLARLLGYTEYNKFKNAIAKAQTACENSGQPIAEHFAQVSDMVTAVPGTGGVMPPLHCVRRAG